MWSTFNYAFCCVLILSIGHLFKWLWFCFSSYFNGLTANSSSGMCACVWLCLFHCIFVQSQQMHANEVGEALVVGYDLNFFSVIEFLRNWSLQTVCSDSHLKNIMLYIFMLLWTFVNQKRKPFNLYRVFCKPHF